MPKEVDPKDTTRAAAYALWMKAPNPMVTFFKTFDVTNLIKVSRKRSLKFNMLLDYCIGRAAVKVKEFYILPVGDKLIQYDTIAVNTIVKNKEGEVSSCDLSYNAELNQFNEDEIYGTGCRKLSGQGLIRKQYGHRHFRHHRYGNRRSCWYEQRHFQQSLYYLGQIQKEMVSVLPAPLFPVPSHADGRRTRRRIFEELAKRD